MHYRGDVDGLRAVAVMAVVLYHAELGPVSGGYVGVDVFFVISGYLITALVASEIRAGSFSLVSFYERRIRRLFPALFAVLAASTLAAYALFLTPEYQEFGRSVAATALFSANFEYWDNALQYFEAPAEFQPLLHTWSLAVEEQFYLVFPLLLLALHRWGVRWSYAIPLVAAASLVLSVWATTHRPEAAFYLLPMRAWELLIGSVLALWTISPPRATAARGLMSAGGLALIALAVFGFSDATAFPGHLAAIPCVGAALVIHAGKEANPVNRLLACRPLVLVGLASYSLYLWHWPIFVFGRYYLVQAPDSVQMVALVAVSVVVAVASWKFVEQPFRGRKAVGTRPRIFASASAAMLVACVAGIVVARTSDRLPPELQGVAEVESHFHQYRDCHNPTLDEVRGGDVCILGQADTAPSAVLWGDSHAEHYIEAVALAAERAGEAVMILTNGGCAPLLGIDLARGNRVCKERAAAALGLIRRTASVDTVILSAYWRLYATGSSYRHAGRYLVDSASEGASEEETRAAFIRGLERTLGSLEGRRVWVMEDIPALGVPVPNRYVRMRFMGRTLDGDALAKSLEIYEHNQAPVLSAFARVRADRDFRLAPVADILCPGGVCNGVRAGRVLYRNGDHLSAFGARLLVPRFAGMLRGTAPAVASTPRP